MTDQIAWLRTCAQKLTRNPFTCPECQQLCQGAIAEKASPSLQGHRSGCAFEAFLKEEVPKPVAMDRNTCPKCGSQETEVRNFNRMWGDGDVHCVKCGSYVRAFDSG